MAQQFQDQGGAASMSPSGLKRWIASKFMRKISNHNHLLKKRDKTERQRLKAGESHVIEYFHQIEDGYSHLAAQVLEALQERYEIELVCHLVAGPKGHNSAEPDLLLKLSRYDSAQVASHYGLKFSEHPSPINTELHSRAARILAHVDSATFITAAAQVGAALWDDDKDSMQQLSERYGLACEAETLECIETGTKRQQKLGHYSGAMFYYGKEWYWGVDRLYHLEMRLIELGIDKQANESTPKNLLVPRPSIDTGPLKDNGSLTLEVYPSLRSPYTSIIFDKTIQLAQETGVKLVVRPVLPMVMRGVPVTRQKGIYIFTDTLREARELGVPFGKMYDPIGEPVRRCYSIYPWACEQGRGNELLSAFLKAAFADGISTNSDKGLKMVVENAGLDWSKAQEKIGDTEWEEIVESNRLAMYDFGSWGVPSFRLLDSEGGEVLALWGQDRLWLFAREIQRLLAKVD